MSLRFTTDHEWIRMEGADTAIVGISEFAQDQLGDIVFVELPAIGRKVKKGEEVAVIESVKAAADCKAPVSGTVIEINKVLADEPGTVNREPTAGGWFFKLRVDDPNEVAALMDETAYQATIKRT
jgi:glycine cleavage system H protein